MKFFILLSAFLFSGNFSFAEELIYKIPFGSSGNQIELQILNESETSLKNIRIGLLSKPAWLIFSTETKKMLNIEAKEDNYIKFSFDLLEDAKISDVDSIVFKVSGKNHYSVKKIKLLVLPPKKIKLSQNYPNPFNPSTVISYQIPSVIAGSRDLSEVKLKIFDILGREVETLVNEIQKPGHYSIYFNASQEKYRLASGVYIYQLSVKNRFSQTSFLRKKMVLLR